MSTNNLQVRLRQRRLAWLAVVIAVPSCGHRSRRWRKRSGGGRTFLSSIEQFLGGSVALNLVHGDGEYWELWHGDGLNRETASIVSRTWQEARSLGYEAYKKKLISEGKYRG